MNMQRQRSDAELVEAACDGDVDSFRCLYEKHYRLAVGIAHSRLRDRHLAEDAAQEAFAVACRELHTLRDAHRFPEWLGTICRRTASKLFPRQDAGVPLQVQPLCQQSETAAVQAAVRDALDMLPVASREILMLHYFSNLSYEEIARSLGISSHAVHGRMQRARKLMARHLSTPIRKENR